MAKIYGDRWELTGGPPLGQGGQAQVFRVKDLQGTYPGELALKRVLNPRRHERFRAEITATKRLSHPNIVRLIDHSAFDDDGLASDKQFLVMPIADGGDLGRADRVGLYEGSVDATIRVAAQVAAALKAAHDAKVIHRDVKPQNILFTGHGHELWLADFGICLIDGQPRHTETGEVVGPRAFMAPELEGGGSLDVTPAADIYSLGKLIYFMISGGKFLPRERLHEPQYARIFEGGERHRLLQLLLQQMICPVETRIHEMSRVIEQLDRMARWEHEAQRPVLGARSSKRLQQLTQNELTRQRLERAEADVQAREDAARRAVVSGVGDWLGSHLADVAQLLGQALHTAVARPVDLETFQNFQAGRLSARLHAAREVVFHLPRSRHTGHCLQILVCERYYRTVTTQSPGDPPAAPRAPRDPEFICVAFYREEVDRSVRMGATIEAFLSAPGKVGSRETVPDPRPHVSGVIQNLTVTRLTKSFHHAFSLKFEFKASEWPLKADLLAGFIEEAVEAFLAVIEDPMRQVGP